MKNCRSSHHQVLWPASLKQNSCFVFSQIRPCACEHLLKHITDRTLSATLKPKSHFSTHNVLVSHLLKAVSSPSVPSPLFYHRAANPRLNGCVLACESFVKVSQLAGDSSFSVVGCCANISQGLLLNRFHKFSYLICSLISIRRLQDVPGLMKRQYLWLFVISIPCSLVIFLRGWHEKHRRSVMMRLSQEKIKLETVKSVRPCMEV